jgi:hypothetical protein
VHWNLVKQSTELCLASSKILTPPLPLANVSCARTKGGGTHSPGGEGGGGVNILEDARHRIGFLQYNLSTIQSKFFRWFTLGKNRMNLFYLFQNLSAYWRCRRCSPLPGPATDRQSADSCPSQTGIWSPWPFCNTRSLLSRSGTLHRAPCWYGG